METNPLENVQESLSNSRLNSVVAVSVALLSTLMGICNVKDDNIVQAMQQAQADKIDRWAFYQARNLREEVARATLTQLKVQAPDRPTGERAAYDKAIAEYEEIAARQAQRKEELRKQAETDEQTYDALNYRDDQFDMTEAAFSIAIALLAVASLTQMWWLFAVAMIPSLFGVVLGVSGMVGWKVHTSWLAQLLS